MSTTIKQVNAALKRSGINAELIRGKNYHYFVGDDVQYAFSTMVLCAYTSHVALDQWLVYATQFVDESESRKPRGAEATPFKTTVH